MRLAILADIHGNIPALEAFLKEIEKEGVDGFVVAGDMVVGPNSVEVLNCLRSLGARMIRGNNENYLLRFFSGEAPDWWYTAHQWSFMRWNYRKMDEASLNFIKGLDDQLILHFEGTDSIRVVHGSPRNASEHIEPEDRVTLDAALEMTQESVLICAHTHRAWQICLNRQLVLNPGSICSTFTGESGGSYAILTWEAGGWEAELRSVPYDIAPIQKAFEDTGLLKEIGAFAALWMHDIERGTNDIQRLVDYAYQQAAKAGYSDSPFVPDDIWDEANEMFEIECALPFTIQKDNS